MGDGRTLSARTLSPMLTPTIGRAALMLLLLGCAPESGGPFGTASARDRLLSWRITPLWSRGGSMDDEITLAQVLPQQVAVIDTNRIVIADARLGRIVVLDAAGRLIAQREVAGDGPGELRRPYGLAADEAGFVAALDPVARRLVVWRRDLSPYQERTLIGEGEDAQIALHAGRLSRVVEWRDSLYGRQWRLITEDGTAPRDLAIVSRPAIATGDFPTCGGRGLSSYPLLTPRIVWTALGDQRAVAVGTSYEVLRSSGDRGPIRVFRDLAAMTADSQLAAFHAADRLMNGCAVPPMEVVRAFGFLPVVPVIHSLTLSRSGELFVQRRVDGRSLVIDVFDVGGEYQGTLPPAFPMPVAFLDAGRFVAVSLDRDDVPTLTLYRVDRR